MRSDARSLTGAAVALLLTLASGCGLLLDDYHIDDSRLAGASCVLGDHRCSGDWLLTCSDTLQGYMRADTCGAPDLCDPDAGVCRQCHPFEVRCNGARLETCRGDGSAWTLSEECSAAELCNVNLAACAPCKPGEYQCNQGALSLCSDAKTWGAAMQCASPALCQIDATGAGSCGRADSCSPGTYACFDRRLSRCDSFGASWQTLETCASAALCSAALATPPVADAVVSCAPAICPLGAYRCEGTQLLSCASDRSAWNPVKNCADLPCNAKARDCAKCAPGTFACQDSDLLSCDANGVFQPLARCAAAELCDENAGVCQPPECDNPGETSCDAELPIARTCGADHKWNELVCATSGLCSARAGRCEEPVCDRGAKRCDHGLFQRCDTLQTGWQTVLSCSNPDECDPASEGCVPSACESGAYRCNDIFLEQCVDGHWQRQARCAAASLCKADAKKCDTPACSKGQFRCVNEFLFRCGPERTFVDYATCDSASQCDDIAGRCL